MKPADQQQLESEQQDESPMFMHRNPTHTKSLGTAEDPNPHSRALDIDEEIAIEMNDGMDFQYLRNAEKSIKRGFIRKVYTILAAQLLMTFGIVLGMYFSNAKTFIQEHPGVLYAAVGLILVTMIGLVCCPGVRRRYPLNYIFLGVFTVAEAYLLGSVTCFLDADTVIIAVALTVLIFVSLTIFSFQVKPTYSVRFAAQRSE